jgi:hypothetical protein
MRLGICALCKQSAELQDSHLIPAGVYRALPEPGNAIRNPILVTAQTTVQTSEQVSDYLLCKGCELRFQQNGEDWLMRNRPHRNGRFPLREALLRSPNKSTIPMGDVYKADFDPGFDLEKLIYFGASVFWRSSAHHWNSYRHLVTPAKLPSDLEEKLRLFLLHENGFPTDLVLLITVTASKVWPLMAHPQRMKEGGRAAPNAYSFMIPGIQFRVIYGDIPDEMKGASVTLCPHAVLVTDHVQSEIRADAHGLRSTSRLVGSIATLLSNSDN